MIFVAVRWAGIWHLAPFKVFDLHINFRSGTVISIHSVTYILQMKD